MAELTTMRNNVLGYPIYALPYVLAFPILDEDGDPVTGLTPDSEISKMGIRQLIRQPRRRKSPLTRPPTRAFISFNYLRLK